jgi:hypothetical protein
VPNLEASGTDMLSARLVIMNGPDDGAEFALEQEQSLISASPEAHVRIQHDPDVPPDGIVVHITSRDVTFENPVTSDREQKAFGDLYTIGQTVIAIYREDTPSDQASTEAAGKEGEAA